MAFKQRSLYEPTVRVAGMLGSAIFNDVMGRMSSAVDALLGPTRVQVIQGINRNDPVVIPDVSIITDCVNRRLISPELFVWAAASQGANFGAKQDSPTQRNASILWEAARQATLEVPSVSFVMDCWSRGYFEGRRDDVKQAIARAGGEVEVWERYLDGFYSFPAVGDLIAARNRELINDDKWTEGLKRNGFGLSWTRRMFEQLRDQLPGPSDLVHFAVKEAFSVDVANAVGLYDEFPAVIMPYMKGQGLGWDLQFQIRADGVERRANVADLYWAAHWQPISPQQAIGMFHLLRPNRLQRYRDAGLDPKDFSLDDVRRWLRINDYPASVREQLVTLSFTPLRLVDIRAALAMNWRINNVPGYADTIPAPLRNAAAAWDRAWGVEQFRDRGVLPEDANTQVTLVYTTAAAALGAPIRAANLAVIKESVKVLREGYAAGLLTRANVRGGLQDLGISQSAADAMLDIEDAKRQLRIAAVAISALRKGYLSGAIQGSEAFQRLQNAGIQEDRAQELVNLWYSEFNVNRRHATTERIIKWVSTGRMSMTDASRRLENLGWDNPDLTLLLAEAEGKALVLRAQAIRAADRDRRSRVAQLDKIRREMAAAQKQVEAAIRRQTPVATLQRWLRKREITRDRFIRRMMQMGYDLPTSELYAEDALRPEPQKIYPKPPPNTTTSGTLELPERPANVPTPPQQQPPAPQPPPATGTTNAESTQPQQLHAQPEQLHTVPGQSQPGGGIA